MKLTNLVVVSDTHVGCRMGLCPPEGFSLDDGGTYLPSEFQLKLWTMWTEFWTEFVPEATRKEPFGLVINGDAVDGTHHRSVTQLSHNLEDQRRWAEQVFRPLLPLCEKRLYMVRGTEVHVGQSGQDEEALARKLGAIPNDEGQHARWELWFRMAGDRLIHFLHHIGTTGSVAYEATAVHKELSESYVEAARWGEEPPDMIVRSHRHRYLRTEIPTYKRQGIAVVTPGWQGKTPFVYRIPGGRLQTPQFGGIVIRVADDELFVRPRVWTVSRPREEA